MSTNGLINQYPGRALRALFRSSVKYILSKNDADEKYRPSPQYSDNVPQSMMLYTITKRIYSGWVFTTYGYKISANVAPNL